MKQIFALLIMLFVSIPGYGDEWDDDYQSELSYIEKTVRTSLETGYHVAFGYARACQTYIWGFIDGSKANGNATEKERKRFNDWIWSWSELDFNRRVNYSSNDFANAFYYAKKQFELNCQYQMTLRRETSK